MTDTPFTRARWTAVSGLVVQIVAAAALLVLALYTSSRGMANVAWFVVGGLPLWFVAHLVFRQREQAALEAADLEALRREKQSVGAGDSIFADEQDPTGLGYRVAAMRLNWMQKWLVPAVALVQALYLLAMGGLLWYFQSRAGMRIGGTDWPEIRLAGLSLAILSVLMLGTFLLSRYASGMARVNEWQLLRGCGSYLLASAVAIMTLVAALGLLEYGKMRIWEQILAYAAPIAMVLLGLETLFNFVADFYRPVSARQEPRAAFDSRLLGLFAEPGGIASSIADAFDYQFGFHVSQTWFYQLLQRTLVPLILIGGVTLWLITCIVIVRPFEHVIIERFGTQLNAEAPYGPGLRLKLPWPIDVAKPYETGRLHEVHVGFKDFDPSPDYDASVKVLQWTDTQHMRLDHFDFLIVPPADAGPVTAERTVFGEIESESQRVPVHLLRMDVAVQYTIRPDRLHIYTRTMRDPRQHLVNAAWQEVSRYMSSRTAEELLEARINEIGRMLRQRIAERVADAGLEVVFVGITNIHPERTVAEAYRKVVQADQERVAEIRRALVEADERLAAAAGSGRGARALAMRIKQQTDATNLLSSRARRLAEVDATRLAAYQARLELLAPYYRAVAEGHALVLQRAEELRQAELYYELGLDETQASVALRGDALRQAEAQLLERRAAAETAAAAIRDEATAEFGTDWGYALIETAEAAAASKFWSERLAEGFALGRTEGEAAALLSAAFAERWLTETRAWSLWNRARLEGEAFRTIPDLYHARNLVTALVEELTPARKFFLAFDPTGREVRVRLVTNDDMRVRPEDVATERREQ
ncbi:MAG: hypothetical protein IPM18_07185 [Phycisphaerales bacterium]|nr:hypothetical protein [Phycisphaerales bacterium]